MDLKHLPLYLGTLLYMGQMVAFMWYRDWFAALIFFGYSVANIGLLAKF